MVEELFDKCFLFDDLTRSQLNLLKPLFLHCDCAGGEIVFKQGDPAVNLYIVMDGEVKIRFKPEDGPALVVTTIHPGGVFGWSAVFGSAEYTSGATCETDSTLLCVRGEDLKNLCEKNPETGILILERLAAVVADRLRSTHTQVVDILSHGIRNNTPK